VQLVVLISDRLQGTDGSEGIGVVEHAKIGTSFRPYVVGLGRMDVGIVSVGRGQDVVVVSGISDLLADVDCVAVNDGNRGPIHEAVDERRGGILENLLDRSAELVGRLRPVVVFHRDHEDLPDFSSFVSFVSFVFFRAGDRLARYNQQRSHAQRAETSEKRH